MSISIIYGDNKFRFYALCTLFIGLIINILISWVVNIEVSVIPLLISLSSLILFIVSFFKDKNKLISIVLSIVVILNLIFIYTHYYNLKISIRDLNTLNDIYLNPITFIPLIYFILFLLFRIYKINSRNINDLYEITKKILNLNIILWFILIIFISLLSLFFPEIPNNYRTTFYIWYILSINFFVTFIIFILSIVSLIKFWKSFSLFFINLLIGLFILWVWFILAMWWII